MKKEIFINESMGETRIAIQEDSQLVEVYVENQDKHRMVGNIYMGKVENVLPGMQAAFVDIGYELNSFLPFSEIALAVSSQDVSIPRTINLVSLLRLTQYFSEIDPSIS